MGRIAAKSSLKGMERISWIIKPDQLKLTMSKKEPEDGISCSRRRYKISRAVCLVGVDGSGKSTLVRLLEAKLVRSGYRVKRTWIRGTHTFASLLARLLSRFTVFRGECNPYYHVCIPRVMKKIWVLIEFSSMIPLFVVRYIIPQKRGIIVLGDRGPLDFLAWLMLTLNDYSIKPSIIARIVESLSLKYCVNIYVRANINVLLSRRPGSRSFIERSLRVYDRLALSLRLPIVDTSKSSPLESLQILEEKIHGKV